MKGFLKQRVGCLTSSDVATDVVRDAVQSRFLLLLLSRACIDLLYIYLRRVLNELWFDDFVISFW